ncbi:ferredoxin [Streptomyces sp. GMY02]|uniref:ferredoxin n=1 Tax=Streptomyces sp. GMY02 TaxID=1333528 RepID=UPI001C2BE4E9|nr:ferredoxin [Streptomyces sp. GMY02]QXE33053.1 ferredoxin [Streptomyces sp. GMY02]
MSWRVAVDGQRCIASGMCAGAAPEFFALDGDSARVLADRIDPDETVLDAADSCPASAITVTEDGREIGPRP